MSAYTQFGYTYPTPSQLLVASGGSPSPSSSVAVSLPGVVPNAGLTVTAAGVAGSPSVCGGAATAGGCCENGRPVMTDPVTGQPVCSCQYSDPARSLQLQLSSYPRLSAYATPAPPYPPSEQNPYPSIGVDSSAFYSPLSTPYGLKDGGTSAAEMSAAAWTSAGLQPTTGYYPYDPTFAAYGYGAGYDLAARRKNATRESTATLKAWLSEHKKNPYPTKGEKIMLAIITKMTLTQVSTWFANARRRLKKENKMTWEPKNKTDDDDDAIVSDSDAENKDSSSIKGGSSGVLDRSGADDSGARSDVSDVKDSLLDKDSSDEKCKSEDLDDDGDEDDLKPTASQLMNHHSMNHIHPAHLHQQGGGGGGGGGHHGFLPFHHPHHPAHHPHHPLPIAHLSSTNSAVPLSSDGVTNLDNGAKSQLGVPLPASKPKIWSLADTATCKTPPPPTVAPPSNTMGMPPSGAGLHNHHPHHHAWFGSLGLPTAAAIMTSGYPRYGGLLTTTNMGYT